MSAELGDAIVYLSAENAQLKKDLDNAQKHTDGWLSQLGMGINIALGNALVSAVGKGIQAVGNLGKSVFDFAADSQRATVYLQSELGATADEAKILGDVAQAVWKNNFGADVLEAAAVVGQVRQQLKRLNTEGIQGAAQLALALRDAYGPQTQDSIDAARTLMEDFNLTYQQAFDFIAAGYQKGLDRSGDFLDSITEYAPQFASAQAGAGQFFSAMETGLQGGMLGTDRALDMFKEFRVRLLDGSTTTADGLKQIGLSVDDISARINNGSLTWTDAFALVQNGIRNADGQATQMQAGVALLGTQFEDMGVEAALSVDLAATSLEELNGAADAVNVRYNNLGDFFQGMGRRLTAALEPAAGALLDIANDAMPELEAGFQSLEANAVPFAVGLAAIFKGLYGLAKAFFGGFRKDANSEMGGTANEAGAGGATSCCSWREAWRPQPRPWCVCSILSGGLLPTGCPLAARRSYSQTSTTGARQPCRSSSTAWAKLPSARCAAWAAASWTPWAASRRPGWWACSPPSPARCSGSCSPRPPRTTAAWWAVSWAAGAS
ncbi:MAG: phage tail tape measure protein [Chloroflexi bacterium]|nr:phage tail tape measure protein [Chloroflexota bacterium]